MPNIKSAKKRVLVNKKKNERNRMLTSELRTAIKKFHNAVETDLAAAEKLLPETMSIIDKAATKGIITKNSANNRKSALAKRLSDIKSGKKTIEVKKDNKTIAAEKRAEKLAREEAAKAEAKRIAEEKKAEAAAAAAAEQEKPKAKRTTKKAEATEDKPKAKRTTKKAETVETEEKPKKTRAKKTEKAE
ncbi:MAG: 30S ribosomal protein S20 [Clostridia bacterium]|nr:30S ribosomal protein S20 [Clostridia bacterium]